MAKILITDRINALQKVLKKEKYDGYVITNAVDMNYITDFHFHAEEAMILVTKNNAFAYCRKLYADEFKKKIKFCKVFGMTEYTFKEKITEKAKALKLKKVGFDFSKESYLTGKFFKKNKFVEAPSFITELRKIKVNEGRKRTEKACKIAYQTYEIMRKKIKTGMTEVAVAMEIENIMRSKGASGTAFGTIVAFGSGAAEPHHVTGTRKLKNNECVLLDFGCVYEGYCSDMTRTWWNGKKPTPEFKKVHALVQKSKDEGIKQSKVGMTGYAIDKVCRDIIKKGGYGKYFIHGTGHSMGREAHEGPYAREIEKEIFKENYVYTIEPGIYLPGKFGVRIEDTVVLTKSGAKILTK